MDEITLAKPDDFHLHLRDHSAMADVLIHTARRFARAVVMPNIKPGATSLERVAEYRNRILSALPAGLSFEPLMTLYLTAAHSPADMKAIRDSGVVFGIKLYPTGATTHSDEGVSDIDAMYPVFAEMEKQRIPLLIHGEEADPELDIFDRERVFVEKRLAPLVRAFPELRIVLEHVSSREAVDFVKEASNFVGATVTVQHLSISRNDYLSGGMNPHAYCMPVVKTAGDREAIRSVVMSGHPRFFAGTDSAPHPRYAKENGRASAGVFTAFGAVELYAEEFEKAGALDKLEPFLSFYGAEFYGLARNSERIKLVKKEKKIPGSFPFGGSEVVPFRAMGNLSWSLEST